MVGWSNRCVVYSEPVRMCGFLAICCLSFGKTPKICKFESLNSIGRTLLKKVTGVLSSQRVCARCKCAVRRAHTKLAWKATAVQAKQHAGKSHVGSPLSTAWFVNKTWMQHPINSSLHATHSGSDFFLQFSTLHVPAALPLNIKWEAMFWCSIRISEDRDKRSSKC